MLSCPWLHVLIKEELRKLHGTSPHAGSPIGVIVTSRAECTLASVSADAASQLMPHAATLQKSLDSVHISALEHGLLHMDLQPTNIVLTKGSVQLIDWGDARSNMCLSKLPEAPNKSAILMCIVLMTEGIVETVLAKKARRAAMRDSEQTTSGFWQRFLGY